MDFCSFHLATGAKGILIGLAAVFIGSPIFIIVRLLDHSNAFAQLLCRSVFFMSVAILVASVRWKQWDHARMQISRLGFLGAVACVFLAAQAIAIYCALLLTSVSNVALLINTSPCFCAVGDAFWLKESVPARTIAMILIGLVSVTIIIGGSVLDESSPEAIAGNLVAMINPISWAIFWAISRRQSLSVLTAADQSRWDRMLAFQLGSGMVVSFAGIVGGIWPEDGASSVRAADWLLYALTGGLMLPLCTLFFSLAPVYISTAEMGCIKMFETVLAPLLAYWYLSEVPTTSTLIGGALLVAAILGHSVMQIRSQGASYAEPTDSLSVDEKSRPPALQETGPQEDMPALEVPE